MITHEVQRDAVRAHVRGLVTRIQREYLPAAGRERPSSQASAALATLRRGHVDDPAAEPSVWEVTIPGMPEGLLNDGGAPSGPERAVHAALVLYAYHQQGRRKPMHVSGPSLGAALRRLAMARGEGQARDHGTLRRFHSVATSRSESQRLYHLRSLVTLLRAEEVPLDYGRLAVDLLDLRFSGGRADRVRYAWGRDLHRTAVDHPDETSQSAEGRPEPPTTEEEIA